MNLINMNAILNSYKKGILKDEIVHQEVEKIINKSSSNKNKEVLKTCFNSLDLTSLNLKDNETTIKEFIEKVNKLGTLYNEIGNIAAICVYPSFVKLAYNTLNKNGINIATVAAGFPHSQTMIEIKLAESMLCIHDGANEIDIVLSIGKFLNGKYDEVAEEISEIKASIKEKKLKVILETGALETAENIYNASTLAMEAGADFIKTSTGKINVSASPFSAYVMCNSIKEFYKKNKRKVGIKVAGGITSTEDVINYYTIIKEILGEEWLNNDYFRIGASRVANSLLSDFYNKDIKYF